MRNVTNVQKSSLLKDGKLQESTNYSEHAILKPKHTVNKQRRREIEIQKLLLRDNYRYALEKWHEESEAQTCEFEKYQKIITSRNCSKIWAAKCRTHMQGKLTWSENYNFNGARITLGKNRSTIHTEEYQAHSEQQHANPSSINIDTFLIRQT